MRKGMQKSVGKQDGVIPNKMDWHKFVTGFGCGTKSSTQSSDALDLPEITAEDFISRMHKELLPGLPNDVTLDHIIPKLPWRSVATLRGVSPSWRQAIKTRQVYNARVQFHSLETLVVIHHGESKRINSISLYSMREKAFYRLPPIPHLKCGFPWFCQLIAMDGKVYIMGGWMDRITKKNVNQDVYVLDLTRHEGWTKCSRMQEERQDFGCDVLHGNIYVFGGYDRRRLAMSRSEMYDPKENKWSSIQPMISCDGHLHHIAAVGDELFLQQGYSWRKMWQAYHPAKDEWRVAKLKVSNHIENNFLVEGKLYHLNVAGVFVHDISTNSWRRQHSISWDGMGVFGLVFMAPVWILHVNNELLVRADIQRRGEEYFKTYLILSKGFGSQIKEMMWEIIPLPFFPNIASTVRRMCPIQL